MIKKLLSSFFTEHFLKSLGFTALLIAVYSLLLSWYLPEGINKNFTQREASLLVLVAFLFFALTALFKKFLIKEYNSEQGSGFRLADLTLLLLPLTPIISFSIINIDMELTKNIYKNIFIFSLTAILLTTLPAFLFRKYFNYSVLISATTAFVFTIYYMPGLASNFGWNQTGSIKIISLVILLVSFTVFLLHNFNRNILYALVATYFFSEVIFSYTGGNKHLEKDTTKEEVEYIINGILPKDIKLKTKPNIYLLIYDAYPNLETTNLYGIDNSAQIEFLKEQGFHVYDGTYSVAGSSIATMSRVLTLSNENHGRFYTAGNKGFVLSALKENNYMTVGNFQSDYYFRDTKIGWDKFSPSPKNKNYLKQAILEGEFRFDIEIDKSKQNRNYFSDFKRDVLTASFKKPVFMYSHSGRPGHTQNSGICRSDEYQMFIKRLDEANKEMKEDLIQTINKDPNAIIIVAGDHGPYLTKNCTTLRKKGHTYSKDEVERLDIQDRYGAFLAIRFTNSQSDLEISILQDVFPEIFQQLTKGEISSLNLKLAPNMVDTGGTSGVSVINGIIHGGVHDGEPLFLGVENVPLAPSHPSNNSSSN